MEIERKFLIKKEQLPYNLESYPCVSLEQAYLFTEPVLRIRKKNEHYLFTYKGKGLMTREEKEFSISQEDYESLLSKTNGNIITKTRYKIPEKHNLTIELDIFSGILEGLYLAEVEFPDEHTALSYQAPAWFSSEVTNENTFHNSTLSTMSPTEIAALLSQLDKK